MSAKLHVSLGLLIAAAALLSAAAEAPAASLDPTFGKRGVSLTSESRNESARALAVDGRGRVVVGGRTLSEQFVVRRYRPDGSADPSFGNGGGIEASLGFESTIESLIVLPNGKILAGGGTNTALALLRLNPDGSEDRSFGHRGHVLTPAGIEGAGILDLARQRSGRIIAGGYRIGFEHWTGIVVGYRPDGSIDPSFGHNGKVRFHAARDYPVEITGVEVLPGGKVLLGGDLTGKLLLARLLPNGKPDPSFGGGDGRVLIDGDDLPHCGCSFANSLAVGPGGRPLLGGVTTAPGPEAALLARFTPDGSLDPSFGRRGLVRSRRGAHTAINAIALQPHGRILAAGYYGTEQDGETQAAVLRYRSNGRLDRSFGRGGFLGADFGTESVLYAALAQPDGRAIVAGRANRHRPQFEELESPLDGAQFLLMRFRAP